MAYSDAELGAMGGGLRDRVAFVTGSSRGIGAVMAAR